MSEKNKVENRGLEEGFFDSLVTTFQDSPALKAFKIKLRYLGPGQAGLEMMVPDKYKNTRGLAHGGVTASLVDTAMGISVITFNLWVVTLEMNLNYLAPVKTGERVSVEGRAVHVGKKTAVAEAEVYNSKKMIVAKSRGTFILYGE